ncbi:hypothetical protein B0T11DRAFT_125097 [Plectosphaerella cucumerina]|uniref:Uncharacterized protein n=1 Tax=Plectosphaerella cucumerina TaxID=40658 RepID=A0A8K0TAB1_9PEZI|nr:hypothetical protein B0T11DRAFT_125097 [Plectosphaerella cucumerina]
MTCTLRYLYPTDAAFPRRPNIEDQVLFPPLNGHLAGGVTAGDPHNPAAIFSYEKRRVQVKQMMTNSRRIKTMHESSVRPQTRTIPGAAQLCPCSLISAPRSITNHGRWPPPPQRAIGSQAVMRDPLGSSNRVSRNPPLDSTHGPNAGCMQCGRGQGCSRSTRIVTVLLRCDQQKKAGDLVIQSAICASIPHTNQGGEQSGDGRGADRMRGPKRARAMGQAPG